MRLKQKNQRRRGATLVESALIFPALVMLLVGAIDLGMGVFNQQILSEAARMGVRTAIVHGTLAQSGYNGGTWGPTTYGPVAANTADPRAQAIAPYLTGLDPSQVNVTYTWPDNSSAAEKRVQLTLTTTWTPVLGFIFGNSSYTLSASSMIPIAH
jgi:Flp pilus assembly protein TadG